MTVMAYLGEELPLTRHNVQKAVEDVRRGVSVHVARLRRDVVEVFRSGSKHLRLVRIGFFDRGDAVMNYPEFIKDLFRKRLHCLFGSRDWKWNPLRMRFFRDFRF